MPPPLIDSHIHLWPESAANADGHGWMTEVPSLAKQHVLADYRAAIADKVTVNGVVYIETDRKYTYDADSPLETWAAGPLEEVRFLRTIIEDPTTPPERQMVKGIILWAPVTSGVQIFEQWLELARTTAGKATWARVKGFRFLLQGIHDEREFRRNVIHSGLADVLRRFSAEGRDLVFDVGIDEHSGGIWQLETFLELLDGLRESGCRTKFVLNHMCKPDLTRTAHEDITQAPHFPAWRTCMRRFSAHPSVYMKLSGAFSEMSTGTVDTTDIAELARRLQPWADEIFQSFGDRVMFGSDWPVCNIRGPAGEDSWRIWRQVVETLVHKCGLNKQAQLRFWSGTAGEAYDLDLGR